jgi:hypothetical protein
MLNADGTPCGSVACYSDSRGHFCGSHWGSLPEQTQESFPQELIMLRDFYDTWVSYHTIPKDRKDSQKTVADYMIYVHTCIQQARENEPQPATN